MACGAWQWIRTEAMNENWIVSILIWIADRARFPFLIFSPILIVINFFFLFEYDQSIKPIIILIRFFSLFFCNVYFFCVCKLFIMHFRECNCLYWFSTRDRAIRVLLSAFIWFSVWNYRTGIFDYKWNNLNWEMLLPNVFFFVSVEWFCGL